MQKFLLVLMPVLLLCSIPFYDWDREAISLVIFGSCLGCWINQLIIYWGTRK